MGPPTGTVTFVLTDIEGSTRLLAELGESYADVLLTHHGIVRAELGRHHGVEVSTEGDSFFAVFASAVDAVRAAVATQRRMGGHPWPHGRPLRVRMGLHTGEGVLAGGAYVGMDVHRVARVAAAAHGGQVLLTHATHALLDGHWPDGVHDVPLGSFRLRDLPAPEPLYQLAIDGAERFPPPRTLDAAVYDLPTVPGRLFGRDADAAAVERLVGRHRLVTLTGPGGVGKTRLALTVAERLRAGFGDGVVFVPLADVRDAELVPDEVARAMALPTASYSGEDGRARLASHLRGRRVLLVLDNVEQLGSGAEVVGRLVGAAPGLHVLVTSRGPLRLREEQQYPVQPLARDAAVEQFLDRARAVRPDLALTGAELAAVGTVVDGVGGLPLAVELAAARVRTLDPTGIAERLAGSLALLSGGPRDLPRRQQALRSTLLWSYELLPDGARRLFAALSAFPGGVTLEALEESVVTVLGLEVVALDCLESLVDQGLVRRAVDGSGRYTMLPPVRELAAEMLAAGDDGPRVWRAAAERLVRLAAQAGPQLVTAQRAAWLDRLQADHENLRVTVAWATAHEARLAAGMVAPIWRYWQMRGYLREGRAVLEAVRDRLPESDVAARAAVAAALGGVAYWQRDLGAGEAAYVEAVDLAEGTGDGRALAQALYDLAFTTWQRGRLDRASELARRAHALFVESGDADGTARVLWLRGILDLIGGDLTVAEAQFAASVDRHRGSPDAFHLGWALRMLGRSLLLQGRADDARGPLRESLRLFASAGDVSAVVLHLSDFALLAKLDGDLDRQVRLVGAVRRLQRLTGTDLVDDAVNAPPRLEETLASLGERGARLLAEGEAMSERDASAYALGEPATHPEPDQRRS